MQYRREIDGLRAIAVIPVILFHAGFTIFSGGFVGVDVFFVISGYLITSIIIDELEQGNFSILRFYERRARRILPALFFIMLICIPFAWMWMLPSQYRDFSQSLIFVSLFTSNILFWHESGYFSASSEEKPLLHTWSLAVEEQYYMLFPVFLILLWRFGRNPVFYSIIVISVISLALSEWGWRFKPVANFYLAPTRIWELLAGSICAFLQYKKPQKSNNAISMLGLVLIVFAMFFYSETTPFPSVYTLVPVVGTALVIMYGAQRTWVVQLLSKKAFVGIGLISYSAYLWHQPLFAFARIRSVYEPGQWVMLLLASASLILAYFSWRYIEQPYRRRTATVQSWQHSIFIKSGMAGYILIAFGLFGHFNYGVPQRIDDDTLFYYISAADKNLDSRCTQSHLEGDYNHPTSICSEFIINNDIDVLFMGDSHSAAISYGVQELLHAESVSSYAFAAHGCIALKGLVRADSRSPPDCEKYYEEMVDFAKKQNVSTIIFTSRFTFWWSGEGFDNGEKGSEIGGQGYIDLFENIDEKLPYNSEIRRNRVLKAYRNAISELADDFNVILVYPIPEAGWHVPKTTAKLAMFGDEPKPISLSTSYAEYMRRNGPVISAFDAIEHSRLYRVKPHEILCDTMIKGRCVNAVNENIYYYDDDHLSGAGAALIAPYILEQIRLIEVRGTNN